MKQIKSQLKIFTIPESQQTLPLNRTIAKQFRRMGEINFSTPLAILRFSVHLATRFYSHKFYTGLFHHRYIHINHAERKVGIRIILKKSEANKSAILYLHGGGGVFGSSSAYLKVLKNLAHFTNAYIFAPDYSRGPEHQFSTALDQAAVTLNWIHSQANAFGIDTHRIAVMGDSAGGALAATLCQFNRDHYGPAISSQILINPLTACNIATKSRSQFHSGFGLTQKQLEFFERSWFRDHSTITQQYSAPMHSENLRGLPPTLMITSEYDPLKDEGEDYAQMLHLAGNEIDAIRFLGMGHAMVAFGCDKMNGRKLYECIQSYLARF